MDQVGVHARTGIHANGARKILRRMAGVLECFPGALEKMAMLRVHDRCVFGAKAEERGIKHLKVIEDSRSLHVVREGKLVPANAASEKFSVGKLADRLDTVREVVPERVNVPRASETACH